ncbi:probable carboxylesterase 17 [Phtheirospermum japonicum]|uniref:Probable carboxylesterase 17 n=1 Tax=Phtheirospermum japonicum TaxID=374723 RepID=A0A830CC66_9LAMI|nr:probable carboxylesterase 17 [Phtheirospermum japonicum]
MVDEKKVIDEVSGWLKLYDDGSVDRTWTGPPQVKFMSDPVPPHQHFIDGVATIDTTSADGLKLRIYLPEKQENDPKKHPILMHFHGGGFCISEADWFMYYAIYKRLAHASRAIVVSVYLRRAPEHRLPAACDDGYAALLWLRSAALGDFPPPWLREDHGGADFERVFLIGDSSGGNIVHQVAARVGYEDLTPLKIGGAIPIHPGFCRSRRSKSELEQPETPFLTLDMVDKFLKLSLPVGATKDHPITCPMGEEAPPLEELRLPPYLYCLAEQDLVKDTQMEFYEAMRRAKKHVELFVSEGVGHSFYLNKIAVDNDAVTGDQTEKLFQRIAEFINKH